MQINRTFTIEQTLNKRQAMLKLFCDRMPSLKPSLIAAKMAHIHTDELHETYTLIDKGARNFTALWRWHFMPAAKSKQSAPKQTG